MHIIAALAAGVKGAENGSATIKKRGTSTDATYYTDFDGGDGGTTGALTLDSNGGATRYVDEQVDVVVSDSSGTAVRSWTEMVSSGVVEVKSTSFTGVHYDTGASAASNPTTLLSVLDKYNDNAGNTADDIDWKVDDGGTPKTLATIVSSITTRLFDVTDAAYGATGDGVTDDRAAVQAAIDAAEAANGGTVYFPPGTYLCSSGLTVSASGDSITLLGEGAQSIIRANVNGVIFTLSSCDRVIFSDLVVDSGVSITSPIAMIQSTCPVSFVRCTVGDSNCKRSTIWLNSGGEMSAVDSSFTNGVGTYHVIDSGGFPLVMHNCTVTNASAAYTNFVGAVLVNNASFYGCTFDASAVSSGTYAQSITMDGNDPGAGVSVVGCKFLGSSSVTTSIAISCTSANMASGDALFVSGCHIDDNVGALVLGISASDMDLLEFAESSSRRVSATSGTDTTLTVYPEKNWLTHYVQTGGASQTISANTMNVPQGLRFTVIVENATGANYTFDYDASQFEWAGSFTLNDNKYACQEWIAVYDTTNTAMRFYQVSSIASGDIT